MIRMIRRSIRTLSLALVYGIALFSGGIEATAELSLPGIGSPLEIVHSPLAASVDAAGTLTIRAAGKTNLFNPPATNITVDNAPMVLFTPKGDFTLKAKVAAPLKNVYDVAALVVYADSHCWAKLCYENSVDKEATVVSVVTRGASDDCNSSAIGAPFVYYAICRCGTEYSFHWSKDGRDWKLVRHFELNTSLPIRVGFAVHAYCDEPISGTFSEIEYTLTTPSGMRHL